MSNILCHLCGGLVDRIGLQPTGVRLCGCVAKFKARKARIALLEKVAVHAQFYLEGLLDADGYELDEALRAAGYEVGV